jgi:Na+/proline symporter
MAAFGVDQDLAQRFLVAKSPRGGAISLIASQFVGFTVVTLFLFIGLLLYVFYQRPDVMGGPPAHPLPSAEGSGAVYQWFLMKELPPIASGLAMAGLFAVAQGSMDSAINALASSAVADLYLPLKKMRRDRGRRSARGPAVVVPGGAGVGATPVPVAGAEGDVETERPSDAPKWAVAGMGAVMTLFAIACAYAYDPKEKGFLEFALGVMNFAFSGMLAVFLTALLTRRGNNLSVVLALLTGAAVVALAQNTPYRWITGALTGTPRTIAFTWAMPIATGLAFLVCVAGRPARREEATSAPGAGARAAGQAD